MHELNLEYLCQNTLDIARIAGNKIMGIYNGKFSVRHKHDKTPLTTADLAAHHFIVNNLQELTPDIPVLSEESECIPYDIRRQWHRYWLVDPLDGTREFIKRNGEFTVNIALIENHQSILGVINVPALNQDYFAWQDGGAFKYDHGDGKHIINTRKLSDNKIIVAASRSHATDQLQQYIDKLGDTDVITMGSSLKSCLVAEGKIDIYPRFGPTAEWDTAAAHCIVEQAGGFILRTDMQPLRYNTKDSLLNPDFFVFGDDSKDWSDYL